MTRINVVPVEELCDQHLLAEHRELTRIPNGILTGKLKPPYPDQPTEYTLGPGHVKFFVNKLYWLLVRYVQLHQECKARGFSVTFKFPDDELNHKDWLYNWYQVTPKALAINRARIQERMPKNARWTKKG